MRPNFESEVAIVSYELCLVKAHLDCANVFVDGCGPEPQIWLNGRLISRPPKCEFGLR